MESLSILVGYGVELAVLLDTAARPGLDAVAQVDLGERAHRNQATRDLAVMAAEIMVAASRRRPGVGGGVPRPLLRQFTRVDGAAVQVSRSVPTHERPLVRSLSAGQTGQSGQSGQVARDAASVLERDGHRQHGDGDGGGARGTRTARPGSASAATTAT